jgi:SSS family solute:Na+ symporter
MPAPISLASNLNGADWTVIIVYLLGIIGLGVWFGKDNHNTRDYFLGSKDIPWWGIGLSIVAAETSALTIIGVPAMAFADKGNLFFLQLIIGYVIARIILAIVMVPHYFKGEIYSPYQLFSDNLGHSARRTAGAFFLISETLAAGVRVYVACIPVQLMLGINVLPAIILFVLLSLVYTYIGGVKAVIWTDAVQFGLFLVGGLFTVFYIPYLFPGGFSEVFRFAAEDNKLKMLNLNIGADGHWLGFQALLQDPINIFMGVIGGTVMVMSTHGAEQLIVQRVLACKNVRDGRRSLILSAVFVFPLFLIFLITGVMLYVYANHAPEVLANGGAKVNLAALVPEVKAGSGIKKNDFIYPIFMLTGVPHILKGFLIVAILSAAMSSVSSALTSLASVSTMDFLKKWMPHRDDVFFLKFSKYSTVLWAGALILVAYLSREVAFVLDIAFKLRGLTSGALLGGLFLAVFWKRGTSRAVISGMVASLLVMTYFSPIVQGLNFLPPALKLPINLAFPWYTLIGSVITLGGAWLVNLVSPAPPDGGRKASHAVPAQTT